MELAGCPICIGAPRPQIRQGGHSGKFFLSSVSACEHVWKVVNYQTAATTVEEAATRWNDWVKTQPTKAPEGPPA
jgi:formate dehydrogenase maturation protein FdhE